VHSALDEDGFPPPKLRWTPRLSFGNELSLYKQEEAFDTFKFKHNSGEFTTG
jgi:hypothetical protein